jgi:hypothetical protein
MIKQSILAALAVTAALAIPAIAQQVAPNDTPAASPIQQGPEAEDSDRDERGARRWRREFRGEERGGRWDQRGERGDRRNDDRDRMGSRDDMMRHRGMGRPCGPQGGRFAERRLERIERATRPTAEQKPAFDALKDASNKAADIIKAACPTETSVTPPGRLAAAEKRLTAMLEAVRTVRPAMEAYYNSLSDEQKARLYLSRRAMGERDGGWRGERGEPRDGLRERERDGYRERRFDRRDRDEDGSPERL